jgi:hypothetical protein
VKQRGQQPMLTPFISVFKKNVGMLELTPWLQPQTLGEPGGEKSVCSAVIREKSPKKRETFVRYRQKNAHLKKFSLNRKDIFLRFIISTISWVFRSSLMKRGVYALT